LIRGIAAASTETVVAVEPSFRSFRCLVGLARVEADPLPGLVRLGRLVLGHWRELLDRPVVNRNGFGRAAALLDQFAGRGRPSAEADKRPHDLAPIGLVPMEPKMVG
jgi:hypothetical protein